MPNVRFGSKAEVKTLYFDVRFSWNVRFVPEADIARVFRESLDAACPFSWTWAWRPVDICIG